MSAHKVIQFPHPLKAVFLAGTQPLAQFTEDDLEQARREGYHRGSEEASKVLERQLMEQREELVHLQSETFLSLTQQHAAMFEQLKAVVPQLVMEAVARILGGIQPEAQTVMRIVDDLLAELTPTAEVVEVHLHPADIDLITGYEEKLREKFPAIAFKPSSDLQPGDGVVRSRFGVIDGRMSTKFQAVEAMFQ